MNRKRKVKSISHSTWTDLRIEIEKNCKRLSISKEEFSEVNTGKWRELEDRIWERFSSRKDSRWIWETLKDSCSTIPLYQDNFKLEELVNSSEKTWFLLDETVSGKTKFWIYEGTFNAFDKIFWESTFIDEVLVVSKKFEWILIINHHDLIIGTGKLKSLIEEIKKNLFLII
ncbi:MAG: DUF6756 family protein [Flavobacteriales bacterium]